MTATRARSVTKAEALDMADRIGENMPMSVLAQFDGLDQIEIGDRAAQAQRRIDAEDTEA